MIKIIFFVPATHLEPVKQAVFRAGGGRSKKYAACCWETLGTLQFLPLKGSEPAIGEKGLLSAVAEYKVEMICSEDDVPMVIQTLLATHPYEEPAYELHQLYTTLDDLKNATKR